jgi:hypothetical protein
LRSRFSRTAVSRFIFAIVVFFLELDAMRAHPFMWVSERVDHTHAVSYVFQEPRQLGRTRAPGSTRRALIAQAKHRPAT